LDLLNELKERLKITIVLISHNISVVKFLSDRVLVMNNGEILESGKTLNIINKPKNNYTKKLMSAIFTVKKKV
jgi:peptide/nickel transport system ATP-binding protein